MASEDAEAATAGSSVVGGGKWSRTVTQCWISDLKGRRIDGEATRESFKEEDGRLAVVGVVVASATASEGRPARYLVDDGTGVIRVAQFLKDRRQERAATLTKELDRVCGGAVKKSNLSLTEAEMLAETRRHLEHFGGEFPVGACVEVRGRPNVNRGELELLATSVRQVTHPSQELERAYDMEEERKRVEEGRKEAPD